MTDAANIWLLTADEEAELRKTIPQMPLSQIRQPVSTGSMIRTIDQMCSQLHEKIADLEDRLSQTVTAHNAAVGEVKSLRSQLAELKEQKALEYLGTHEQGRHYRKGDFVTYAGSLWHANEQTTQKPGDGPAWTLAVKRGRDGKDAPR